MVNLHAFLAMFIVHMESHSVLLFPRCKGQNNTGEQHS